MAPFIVQVFKTHPLELRPWSNRYLVEAASLADATDAADLIHAAERSFHKVAVQFTYARISTVAAGDGSYTTLPINLTGAISNPSDNYPLWNTLRVDFTVNGGGRPSRKFYRLPLGEEDVANYVVSTTVRDLIETNLAALIDDLTTAGTPLVDPDGQAILVPLSQQRVQMRQLHRKRKKTTTTP